MGGKEKHDVEMGWPPHASGERAVVCDQHEHVQRDDDGPDWATLNAVNTARHILTGSTITLTTEQKCKLNRNLIKGWVRDVCVRRSMETLAEEPA